MTKLRLEQLPQDLRKGLRPVYLISGDERLLVQEASDGIRKAASKAGFTERARYDASNPSDWSQLFAAGNSPSLFADKKLIEFHTEKSTLGNNGSQAIIEYLANPSEDNLLLIVTPKLKAAQQKAKWLQAITQQGVWVPIWSLDNRQFRRWVDQRLKAANLDADGNAIDVLVDRTEGNLLAAAQEIEKLTLLVTDGKVSSTLMADAVGDSARFNVFELADKTLYGDAQGAARCLQGLRNEGVETPIILWSLTREVRSLLMIKQAVEDGQTLAKAFSHAGIWDKRKPLVQQALNRLSGLQLAWLLRRASAIDKAIKGLRDADAWSELLELTLNLAGTNSVSVKNQRLAM